MINRDLRGYGPNPPTTRWREDARIAVSIVVNIEEGAELSLSTGDEKNEGVYEVNDLVEGYPDPCMASHFEYGSRVGYWRILDTLEEHGVTATFSTCGRAVEVSPWLASEAVVRGHEISAHGYRWERHAEMDEEDERSVIRHTIDEITKSAGVRPVGWHTRSASSVNTRRLLIEEGGFLYDSDAYNDDIPYLVDGIKKPHVIMPYSFDTNDMRFFNQGGFIRSEDFACYCIDAFDNLWNEGSKTPRMLSIGLHPRIIGRPGRIGGLKTLLDHVLSHDEVWVAPRRDIAEFWIKTHGS